MKNNTLTCAIVEDDDLSLMVVTSLAEKTRFLKIEATFNSPEQAMIWLAKNEIDLLFLDVEMPGMSGLEMLRVLPYKPDVIVISGKPGYAVEAFDLSVIDYLIKPLQDYSRFLAAVNKVIAKRNTNMGQEQEEEHLFVKVDSLLLKLNVDAILWIEAFGDYIKIQTIEKTYTVYATLKKLEEKLSSKKFVRVHRSFIVNLSKISNIDPNNLEINKKIIPVSATYKEQLLSRISIL
ncbi:LytTR family DNA-binding domain-containing protein [Chryseolinea sp. H1M3-3]|uniref:LytR/AlgR family response regulator transcription factor n=1 Tax=Chryseolinea sp. H1M3-3 TaxID=3034144 RepID=UPI0023EAE445|nr:LytTR family DNA-binding domain-containing protein [Chryseolinea sp. H1M3-3]